MELIDNVLSPQEVHDFDILVKSLKYLRTFFLLNKNKTNYLLNGCIVDKTYRLFERNWTPAALCMVLARTTVPSLVKLPRNTYQREYDSVVELKARLKEVGITLRLEDYSYLPDPRRKYVIETDTFTWILEPSYVQ